MKITFLGTGTSSGVPVIACDCPVCRSTDLRNRRRRASLYIEACDLHLVVDTTPDFREQCLANNVRHIDAVLYTHSHADHIFGLDDIRRFNTIQQSIIPAYATEGTLTDLRRVFDYVDQAGAPGTYRPRIQFREIDGAFNIGGIHVVPLPVVHENKPTVGFLFEADGRLFGYVPDCQEMPPETVEALQGVEVMILDALRHRPHATHLTVEASLALLKRIGARTSYIIHMCHDLDHEETQKALPEGVRVSYDGLVVEW